MKIILFVLTGAIVGFLVLSMLIGDIDDLGCYYVTVGAFGGLAAAFLPLKDKKPPNMKARATIASGILVLSVVSALISIVLSGTLEGMNALGPIIFGLPFCALLALLGILSSNNKISTSAIIFWSSIITATALLLLGVLG